MQEIFYYTSLVVSVLCAAALIVSLLKRSLLHIGVALVMPYFQYILFLGLRDAYSHSIAPDHMIIQVLTYLSLAVIVGISICYCWMVSNLKKTISCKY